MVPGSAEVKEKLELQIKEMEKELEKLNELLSSMEKLPVSEWNNIKTKIDTILVNLENSADRAQKGLK